MYQHVNHATMVTILEEARVPFLQEPFGAEITTIGLLIHEVRVLYKGQLRLVDSPLQVTIWTKRVRAVDFTLGYEVRPVDADPSVKAVGDRRDAAGDRAHQRTTAATALTRAAGLSATLDAMTSKPERGLWLPDAAQRANLGDVRRTGAPTRRRRGDPAAAALAGRVGGLGGNGFRCAGEPGGRRAPCARPTSRAGADELLRGLSGAGRVRATSIRASRWTRPGAGRCRPNPASCHSTTCPREAVLDLAQRGAEVSKEQGSQGPPVSLLDQEVIHVSGAGITVGIPMRCVFALTAMGFVETRGDADEVVRVRTVGHGCASTRGTARCTDRRGRYCALV